MEKIQIIGIQELKQEELEILNKIASEYYEKIKTALHNEVSLKIHMKKHSKTGKKHKSDIKIQVLAPTRKIEAQESDWDLARTLHRVFKNLERQIEHRFK